MSEQGNIDMSKRPRVRNADGSVSTVRSMSFNEDGREILVPTVSDDGRIMTEREAIEQYHKTGKHLGKFSNPTEATAFAQSLHNSEAAKLSQPILFKKPDGSFVTVDSSEAQQAQSMGYVPSTPEQMAAGEQTGRAFVEGAARGATFGLSDPLLKTLGGGGLEGVRKTGAEMKARKEENPWAAGGGEVVGAIGTTLATGGGASALVGGGVKGAAFEAGLYGMGSMVSEAALENRELTSDRLASGLVGGALAGGVAQGTFSLLGKGVSVGISKFGGKGLKDTLGKAADDVEWRALAESNVKWARNNEPFKEEILKLGREKGILGKASSALDKKTAEKAQSVASEYASKIAGQMDDLEKHIPLKGDNVARMKFVNHLEQELDDEFGMNPVFDEAVGGVKKLTERIANEPGMTWPKLWEIQSSLFKDVPVTGLSPASQQVRETVRKSMRDFVFDHADNASQLPAGFGGMMRKTGREARAAMALSKALSTRAQSIESSGGVVGLGSLKSMGVGAMAGFSTGNPLAAIAGAVGETQLRKRGGLMGAAALRAISESSVTNGITKALNGHIGQILATAPEMLGAYRYPLAVAAAQGADALLQEHIRLASSEEGSNYLSTVALEVEDEAGVEAAGARLAVVDALEVASKEHLSELDGAIDGLFGSARGRKASMGAPLTAKGFKTASESIQKMVSDPTAAFEAVPEELRAGAPSTSAEAAAKLVMMAQYLDSKMPKDPNAGMPASVAAPWQPSQYDLDKFNRYREAVENPARVLKNMAAGYISPEQVEALQAVYPAMYADLQQKIGERLMAHKKPLSYQQRLAMSAIVGPRALGMSLQQQQILQQSQAVAAAADQEAGNSTSPDGRQDVNQEDNLDTQATRLERR